MYNLSCLTSESIGRITSPLYSMMKLLLEIFSSAKIPHECILLYQTLTVLHAWLPIDRFQIPTTRLLLACLFGFPPYRPAYIS